MPTGATNIQPVEMLTGLAEVTGLRHAISKVLGRAPTKAEVVVPVVLLDDRVPPALTRLIVFRNKPVQPDILWADRYRTILASQILQDRPFQQLSPKDCLIPGLGKDHCRVLYYLTRSELYRQVISSLLSTASGYASFNPLLFRNPLVTGTSIQSVVTLVLGEGLGFWEYIITGLPPTQLKSHGLTEVNPHLRVPPSAISAEVVRILVRELNTIDTGRDARPSWHRYGAREEEESLGNTQALATQLYRKLTGHLYELSSSASGIQSRGLEKDLVRTLIMRAVRFCQAKVYCTTPLSPFTFRRVLRERVLLLNHLITHLVRRFHPCFNTPSYIREEREQLRLAFREEPDYSDPESMLSDAQSVLAVFFQALPLSKIVKLLPYFAEFTIRDEAAGSSQTRQLTQSDVLQHGIDLGPRLRSLYNRLLHDLVQGTLNLSTRAMCVVESALLVLDKFANTGDSHQVATVNLTQTLPEAKAFLIALQVMGLLHPSIKLSIFTTDEPQVRQSVSSCTVLIH